jgi:hypothetical protein
MKNIAFLVDDGFHKDFKIHCASKDIDMKNRIIELMRQDMKQAKKEQKK